MGLVVDLGEVLEVEVGIDLRGADVGVAEQFLYSSQVTAGLQQMAGEGMPEQMRMEVPGCSGAQRPAVQSLLHRPPPEALAAAADEQRRLVRSRQFGAGPEPVTQGS